MALRSQRTIIARQDADDISERERLSKQLVFLESHPEVALVGTWYKKIDASGVVIGQGELPCDCNRIRWCLLFSSPFVHGSVLFRKSIIDEVGVYNEAFVYSQDYELWRRIALHAVVANLPEHLMQLRTSPSSMTATYGERVHEGERLRIAAIERFLGWDKNSTVQNRVRFHTIRLLIFGQETKINPQAVIDLTPEILRLHSIFCRTYRVAAEDGRKLRLELSAQLSRRLVSVARSSCERTAYPVVLKLLLQSSYLHWAVI